MEPLEGRLMMTVNAWKSAVSGDWTDATKWSLGHVPTSTEDVSIVVSGNYTVKHATTAANTVKSLTISGQVELDAGSITVTGATTVEGSGKLTFKGGTLAKTTLTTTGSGAIVTTTSAGALDGVTVGSSFALAAGTTLDLRDTTTFANAAKISVGTGHLLMQDETTGASALAGTGTVNLAGGTLVADSSHSHDPSLAAGILLDGYGSTTFSNGINNGTIQADVSGKTLNIAGSLANKGTAQSTSSATLQLTAPSTFSNTGTLAASAGTVLISGAFNAGTGTLAIGIGGTGQGTTYGLINVAGALTLGGTLQVGLIGTFAPLASQAFTPLKFTSQKGSFAHEKLLTDSLTFTLASTATTMAVTAPKFGVAIASSVVTHSEKFTNGTFDVVQFKVLGLLGVDTDKGPAGQAAGVIALTGTWTATGTASTPLLAAPGAATGTGSWTSFISTALTPPAGYGDSYVNMPSALGASRTGTGTTTLAGTHTVTAITGTSSSFTGTWYTLATALKTGTLFAQILVMPGDDVTFSGEYSTYGSNAVPIAAAYPS